MKQCNLTGEKKSKIKKQVKTGQDMKRRAKTRTQKNENDAFNLTQGKYLQGA